MSVSSSPWTRLIAMESLTLLAPERSSRLCNTYSCFEEWGTWVGRGESKEEMGTTVGIHSLGRPRGYLIFSLMALIRDPILIFFKGF